MTAEGTREQGPGALALDSDDISPAMAAVALAPAARGYPGGIAGLTGDEAPAGAAPPDNGMGNLARADVWRRSFAAWEQAGLDWEPPQPPCGGEEPATAAHIGWEPGAPATGAGPALAGAAARAGATTEMGAAPGAAAAAATAVTRRPGRRLVLVAAAICAVMLVGIIAGVAASRSGPTGRSRAAFGPVRPAPPARLADGIFPAGGTGAIQPHLAALAAAGQTVVAAGSQPGLTGTRPVILVSVDGGRTWQRASLPAVTGGPGTGPTLVAGGGGSWLALGSRSGWASTDGRTWRAVPGLPATAAGDQITALARVGSGFAAAGNTPAQPGHPPTPVVWTSPDGLIWHQAGPGALGLTARAAGTVRLRWVAARGNVTMIGGEVNTVRTVGRGPHRLTLPVQSPALWRSSDGGLTWHRVLLPGGGRAAGGLRGLAETAAGFVAVRSGVTPAGRSDAVVYASTGGLAWQRVAALAAGPLASLRTVAVAGSDDGAVVAGLGQSRTYAFVSSAGRRWRRVPGVGPALGTVTALTAGPRGTLVAAGLSPHSGTSPAGARAFLAAGSPPHPVGQAALAGAAATDVTVSALARHGARQVAAGTAGGSPAIWWSGPGSTWSRSRLSLPPAWNTGALASAAWGRAGWLALGSTATSGALGASGGPPGQSAAAGAGGQARPVVLTSADGSTWQPAPNAGPLLAPGVTLAQAAAGPGGYVVVGGVRAGGGQAAAAWYSADLSGWWQARQAGLPAAAGAQQMLGVAAAGRGFVAAGYAGNSPAVWTSAGGTAWRLAALPLPARAGWARLTSVTAAGRRVVATGTAATPGGTEAFAAWSADGGRTWRESPLPRPPGMTARRFGATTLTAVPGGFLAAGAAATATGQDVLVWWSRTGMSWHAAAPAVSLLHGPGWHTITALLESGGRVTAAGYVATGNGQHPILWQPRFR